MRALGVCQCEVSLEICTKAGCLLNNFDNFLVNLLLERNELSRTTNDGLLCLLINEFGILLLGCVDLLATEHGNFDASETDFCEVNASMCKNHVSTIHSAKRNTVNSEGACMEGRFR